MPRFPFATYAALLAPEQRDTFAAYAHGRDPGRMRFVECGLGRAVLGLSLAAKPGR